MSWVISPQSWLQAILNKPAIADSRSCTHSAIQYPCSNRLPGKLQSSHVGRYCELKMNYKVHQYVLLTNQLTYLPARARLSSGRVERVCKASPFPLQLLGYPWAQISGFSGLQSHSMFDNQNERKKSRGCCSNSIWRLIPFDVYGFLLAWVSSGLTGSPGIPETMDIRERLVSFCTSYIPLFLLHTVSCDP